MSRLPSLALGLALPITLMSQVALADLSPNQVWTDWRGYMEGMGYDVQANEETNGDTLTVSGVTLGFEMDGNTSSIAIDQMDFIQNSDGTVAISLPETLPLVVTGKGGPGGDEDIMMRLSMTQSGHVMTASGAPNDLTYVYKADQLAVALDEMTIGNITPTDDEMRFTMISRNLDVGVKVSTGEMRVFDQTGTVEDLSYDLFVISPDGDNSKAAVKGAIGGISFGGQGALPLSFTPDANPSDLLAAGMDVGGTFVFSQGSSEFDIQNTESGNYQMNTASDGGSVDVKMDARGVAYKVSQKGLDVTVQPEGIPAPFDVKMAESGFNLTMPVAKSDDPQDFALGITLGDFTMSDMIWGMFDPAGQLPRDPATILLDLTGKVKLLVDWLDPTAVQGLTQQPGEVRQITLNNLLVNAAGARFEGQGDVAFDGAPGGLVPGAGNPVGDVNLALAGGNGLLDKLVAMGLLPQDQAMGARMMMGLFTVPGDAPDTLRSKIEFTQNGQILANGQRLR